MAARRGSTMFGRRNSLIADPVELPGGGASPSGRNSVAFSDNTPKGGDKKTGAAPGGRRGSTAGGRRKSVAGRRKSVTAGAGAAGGGRRKSVAAVTATTPKELGESQLTQSGSKVGDLMWARMPPKHPEVYEKTQVLEVVAGTKVKVKLPSGAVEEYAMTELLPCNTESDLDDVCALTFLSEAAVLDCVRSRFLKKKIYTWVARILIAMNPFERLNIYGDDAKQQYATLDPRAAPPHIFAVGETAYRAISRKGKFKNQAIIVSGESGSGKTVGNKLLMDYFAFRSGGASASTTTAEIAKVMHDSNPVLEAFGNAKTTRNSNSSRFGKFQIMNFSEKGEIGTITIATYLLEKSRVTSITDPERNYHAFYMLLAGGGPLLGKFELSPSVKDYYYLNQSNCHAIDDMDDAKEYADMTSALTTIGANDERTIQIYTSLAAVLHLGNITFKTERGKADASSQLKQPMKGGGLAPLSEESEVLPSSRGLSLGRSDSFGRASGRDSGRGDRTSRRMSFLPRFGSPKRESKKEVTA